MTATAEEPGHVPTRMCAVCRVRKPKRELTRYVAAPRPDEGEAKEDEAAGAIGGFCPDPAQTLPGRGLYLCGDPKCAAGLAKRRGQKGRQKGHRKDHRSGRGRNTA